MKGPAGKMSDDDEVNTGVEGKAEELTRNVVDKFAEAKRHSDLAHAEERARRFNVGERERLAKEMGADRQVSQPSGSGRDLGSVHASTSRRNPGGDGGLDLDVGEATIDLTPQEQMQFIHNLTKANANMKMKVFYAEKRIEELTVATGLDEDQLQGLDSMLKNNVEQSVKIEELQTDLNERNEIIGTCNKHIASLERDLEELRRSKELTAAERETQAQAAAIEAATAAATVADVLKELQDLQLDNSSLMERAANAEAELSSTREKAKALEADLAAQKAESRASLQRSMVAVASQQAAEEEIVLLRHRLNAAIYKADEAVADREVALAREVAVREELGAREAIAAGSLEAKVQAMMDAEVRRRDEHARALDAARATVLAAREETAQAEQRAETARSGRRQAAMDIDQLKAQCAREVQAANDARDKAMKEAQADIEENERKLRESAQNAEEAVARCQAHAREEIELLKKRFDVDLAQARQRAERTADETVRKALERSDEKLALAVQAKEAASAVNRALKDELMEARSSQAEAEMALATANATCAALEQEVITAHTAVPVNGESLAKQIADLTEKANYAADLRDEAVTELERVTEALVKERGRAAELDGEYQRCAATAEALRGEEDRMATEHMARLEALQQAEETLDADIREFESDRAEQQRRLDEQQARLDDVVRQTNIMANTPKSLPTGADGQNGPALVEMCERLVAAETALLVSKERADSASEARDLALADLKKLREQLSVTKTALETARIDADKASVARAKREAGEEVLRLRNSAAAVESASLKERIFALETEVQTLQGDLKEARDSVGKAVVLRPVIREDAPDLVTAPSKSSPPTAPENASVKDRARWFQEKAVEKTPGSTSVVSDTDSAAFFTPQRGFDDEEHAEQLAALQRTVHDLEAQLADATAEIKVRDRRLQAAETDLGDTTAAVTELGTRVAKREQELVAKHKQQVSELEQARVAAEKLVKVTQNEADSRIEELTKQLSLKEAEVDAIVKQQRQLEEELTTPQKAANPLFTGESITTSEKIAPAMMAFQSPPVATPASLQTDVMLEKGILESQLTEAKDKIRRLEIESQLAKDAMTEARFRAELAESSPVMSRVPSGDDVARSDAEWRAKLSQTKSRAAAMEVRLQEQLDEAVEKSAVQEREADANLRKQLNAARQKAAAQIAEAEEEFENHIAQANKKIKRLDNELREAKAELEASGPGLKAAAPSPVRTEAKPTEKIRDDIENELRHSLNKAQARISELITDLVETREQLSSLEAEWKLKLATANAKAKAVESRLQSRLAEAEDNGKDQVETEWKEKFTALKAKATADEARLQDQLDEAQDTIFSMEQNFERRLRTQLSAAKQKAAADQADLTAKFDEAEDKLAAIDVEWRAKISEAKTTAAATEAGLRAQLAEVEENSLAAESVAGAGEAESKLRAELVMARQKAAVEIVDLKASLSAAEEEIVALKFAEKNHRAALERTEQRMRTVVDEALQRASESEEMMKAQMQTALDKSSAAKIDLQLQLKKAAMKAESDEEEHASQLEELASNHAAAEADFKTRLRATEDRFHAQLQLAEDQLQATQNEWRAKLSEAKSKAAAAESRLRSQLADKEESSMADVIARTEASEVQLRAQLLDVKQQASSERSRLETQMAEVEEKVGAIEAQCRLKVSDAMAKAAEAETKLAKHIKEAQNARAEITTLKDDLVKAAVLETKLRAEIDDEQKQNRDLNAKLTHAQTSSSSSEGEMKAKLLAAKMVEAELRDSLSTVQSRVNQLVLQVDTADSRARSSAAVAADDLEVMTRKAMEAEDSAAAASADVESLHMELVELKKTHGDEINELHKRLQEAIDRAADAECKVEEPGSPVPSKSKMDSDVIAELLEASMSREADLRAKLADSAAAKEETTSLTEARELHAQLDSVRRMVASLQAGVQARDEATTEAMTPDGKGISKSSSPKTPELAASRATVNSLTSLLETASVREGELRAQLHAANQRVQDLEREKHEQELVAQTQLETIQQQLQQLQPQRDHAVNEGATTQVSTMAVVPGPARAPRAYNPMWGAFPGYVHPMFGAPAPADGTAVGALAAALEAAGEREGELKAKLVESQASAATAAVKLADAIAIARSEVDDSVKDCVMELETEVRNLSAELKEKAHAAQTFKASLVNLQDTTAILEQEHLSAKAHVRELEARLLTDEATAEAKLKIVLGDVEAAKAETEAVRAEAKHKIEANWDQANRSVAMAQEDAKKDRDAIVGKETELVAARELIAAVEGREAETLERVAALELQLKSAQTQLKSTESQLKESQDREGVTAEADKALRVDLNKAEARVKALLEEIEATRAAAMESSRAAKSASARAESMAAALTSASSGGGSDMKLATAEARVAALEVELSIAQRSAALNAKEADRDQHALLSKAEQAGKDSMMSTVNKLEDTVARLQESIKEANAEVERLKTRLSAAEKIAAHANTSLGDASDRTRKAFEDASVAKTDARTAKAELTAAKDRVTALKRELDLAVSRAKQADAEATAAMTRAHIAEADIEELRRRALAAEAEVAAARDAADANERKRKDAEGRMEALRSTLRHARDDLGLGWTDRPRPIGKLPTPPTDDTDDDAAMQAQAEDIVQKLAAAKARLHPAKGLAPRAKNRHD